jgi:hypothetical protein
MYGLWRGDSWSRGPDAVAVTGVDMADYLKKTLIVVAVGLLTGGLAMLPAAGQVPEADPGEGPETVADGELIGVIPGTGMMRDEFRARALVQLKAVALSALAYRLLHDDQYAPDLLTLKSSESWNLDLLNIFSGRPVRALYFEPQEEDFTTRPAFDLPMVVEQDGLGMDNLATDGALDLDSLGQTLQALSLNSLPRVDPRRIRQYDGGDIYYYVAGDMLQLVMFAPDGSYIEHVDQSPNGNWRSRLATPGSSLWPDSVLAAQVLYFTGELLPRHHNLVQFMGERDTLAPAQFPELSTDELLNMALDLGIVILNPASHQPAMVVVEHTVGEFVPKQAGDPALRICMRDGRAWTLDELHEQAGGPTGGDERPDRPSSPPLGGRR